MKFYTAEMVNRWNGDHLGTNKEVYDKEWDEAQDSYERHYARLADGFPTSVRKFAELVLHNEAVIALPKASLSFGGDDYTVVVANQHDSTLHAVTYTLEGPPVMQVHGGGGFDPPESAGVWLYDEFDVDDTGLFTHSVLFSNGVELTVTFKTMHWYECAIQEEG